MAPVVVASAPPQRLLRAADCIIVLRASALLHARMARAVLRAPPA